ncbi:MAG: phosphodiester glycosidase family protein [Phormidesmis sp.]
MSTSTTKLKEGLLYLGLLLPLAWYGHRLLQRPSFSSAEPQLIYQGITYSRHVETAPRPQVIHILEIDLTAPGLKPFSTPSYEETQTRKPQTENRRTQAQRTSDFLQTHQLQLAVNANFFYPFKEIAPWNYGPRSGTPTSLVGVAISNSEIISQPHPRYSALCLWDGRAEIVWEQPCPTGTEQGVSGQPLWLKEGSPPEAMAFVADKLKSKRAYPLTIAALNAEGTRLWLLLSDGKQPLYSEGTTIKEASERLKALGAVTAVQLDGGGSTTLAIEVEGRPQVINAVIHAKVPGLERPVANHLGFYAQPLAPQPK